MLGGNGGQPIFFGEEDRQSFETLVADEVTSGTAFTATAG